MTSYAWAIDVDHLFDDCPDGRCDVGTVGPSGTDRTYEEIASDPSSIRFRMLDDDGEVYYEGMYLGPDDERMFAPLDDFGRPNAGCTEIQYLNLDGGFDNQGWKTL